MVRITGVPNLRHFMALRDIITSDHCQHSLMEFQNLHIPASDMFSTIHRVIHNHLMMIFSYFNCKTKLLYYHSMNIIKIMSGLVPSNKQKTVIPQTNTSDASSLPSLDFAFDLVKERIDNQLSRIDGLDTKTNSISGSAIAILGIGLTLQTFMLSLPRHSYCSIIMPYYIHMLPSVVKHALLVLPIIVTSVIAVLYSQSAYKVGKYEEVPVNPETIFYEYLEKELHITKIDIYDRMRKAFKTNEEKIEEKVRKINCAILWLNIEISTFVVLFICLSIC
jgi:hypothetical protein